MFPIRKFRLFLKTMSLRLFRKRLSDRPAQVFIGTAAAQTGLYFYTIVILETGL